MSPALPIPIRSRPMQLFFASIVMSYLFMSSCMAQTATPQRSLLALSKGDHILAIVDPTTLKIIARIPVGSDPHEVVASDDGKTAYVTNQGSGQSYEIDAIDLIGQRALPNIDIRPLIGPHGIAFAGGRVWFTAQDSKSIGRYDPASGRIDWCMGTGQDRTHMIYVSPDLKKIYTTNVSSGTVSIFENVLIQPHGPPMGPPPGAQPSGQQPPKQPFPGAKPHLEWVQTIVPVSRGSEGFDVSPDGREIWTAASENGTIWVIDTSSKKVTDSIDAKVVGANRLKFTPDGRQVFVSSLRSGDLYIFDATTHREKKRIHIGQGTAGILMDPVGHRAFVASTGSDSIAIVDLGTLEVTGHLEIGGPDGLAWAVRP